MSRFTDNNKYNHTNKTHLSCIGGCGSVFIRDNANFYKSNNDEYSNIEMYAPYCKQCLRGMASNEDGSMNHKGFLQVLKIMNRPYIVELVDTVMRTKQIFELGEYLRLVGFIKTYKKLTFLDSETDISCIMPEYKQTKTKGKNNIDKEEAKEENIKNKVEEVQNTPIVLTKDDIQNQTDSIRMLGYDPFVVESEEDRRFLFNKLIDFLDEDTLADNFKCLTVIEIVQLFKQADKINRAMSNISVSEITTNPGIMKSMVDTKNKALSSALSLAKDNGISSNHNNNKSKGGNTLSGINKRLQEIGLESAELNLYDIETSKAMKQIADISNKSILDTLMFDENDSMVMIAQQRETIVKLTEKANKFEEEARLLRKQLNALLLKNEKKTQIE